MSALIPALINLLLSGIRRGGGGGGVGGYGGGMGRMPKPQKTDAQKDDEYWGENSLKPHSNFAAERGKNRTPPPSWGAAQKPFGQ